MILVFFKIVFGESNDLVVESDAYKSIANGFSFVYQLAKHGLCAFYLYKILKKSHKSLSIEDLY